MTATVRFDKWENTASTKSVTMDQIANGSGLVPVVPTSVSVGSGTGTVGANGLITFSGVSTLTLNGVFTSGYKNYRLAINVNNSSGQTSIGQQLTTSGTAWTTGDYFWAGNWQSVTGSGPSVLAASSQTAWYMIEATNSVSWFNHTQDIFNPALATSTSMTGSGVTYSSAWRHITYSSLSQTSTSFDGMKFISSTSNTFSGTIQVYGYR